MPGVPGAPMPPPVPMPAPLPPPPTLNAGGREVGEAPSRLLCLRNLLSAEALTDDAEFKEATDDIQSECSKHGEIDWCKFPRASDLQGCAAADVGSCFVRFKMMSSAVRAQRELDGREFDSQTVIATFVAEDE